MARPSKQQEIGIWLKGLLSAGRRKAEDVIAAAVAAGYATNPGDGTRTLRRVKTALDIRSEQEGEVWYWRDPSVAQPKAASEDKLDILIHEVKEAKRLALPAVPVAAVTVAGVEPKPIGILGRRSRAIDIKDPEVQAQFEQIRKAEERFEEVQKVVTSADPFKLLDSASQDEIDQMMLLVRNHQAVLMDRERGKPRFVHDTSGALVPDGFEPGEDVTLEMGKWDTWIDRAKKRDRELVAAERQKQVLSM